MSYKNKRQNEQTQVFKIVDDNNQTVGFVNLLDDMSEEAYQFLENHLCELLKTKQVTIVQQPKGSSNDGVNISNFVISK